MRLSVFRAAQSGVPVFDNTRRFARVVARLSYYSKIGMSAWGRIPLTTMLRSHFTWALAAPSRPAYATVELTNHCNLKCAYCTSPLALRPRGFMSDDTLEILIAQIREYDIPRVRVLGDGEPTLHPRFDTMIGRLAPCCRY